MKANNFNYSIELSHKYLVRKKSDRKRIFLLLHGFQMNAEYMMKKFENILDGTIIAANGPFLVPTLIEQKYEPRFSWYFFNPTTKEYYIEMLPAAKYLNALLEKENPNKYPVTIIGHSQGGYLAPKVCELVKEVDKVIGIACTFRNKKFSQQSHVSYNQIHSKDDPVVRMDESLKEFESLKNNSGRYIQVDGSGHKIDKRILDELKQILE